MATPESFTALLELLDNQRFARGTPPDRKQLNAVMIRRLKTELPKDDYGNDRFPKRPLEAIEVDYPEDEQRIHAALREYTKLRHEQADDASERFATEFVLLMLKKRLFSSPAAFAITLAKHEDSLSNAKKRSYSSRPTHGILQHRLTEWKKNTPLTRKPKTPPRKQSIRPSASSDPPQDHRSRWHPGPSGYNEHGRLRPGRPARSFCLGDAQGKKLRA